MGSAVHDGTTDVELAAALARHDADALAEAYRRHGGAVWALARRVLRDPQRAEDVAQGVFTDLWAAPGHYDPARCFRRKAREPDESNRRRGGAPRGERPASLGRETPRQAFLACRVMARQWCGDPHQRFSALRSLPFEGTEDETIVARMIRATRNERKARLATVARQAPGDRREGGASAV